MSSKQLPFLSPDECRAAGIPVVRHTTHVQGEDFDNEIGQPRDAAEALTFYRDDDRAVAKAVYDSAKLVMNTHVAGPMRKEIAEKKAAKERLDYRRTFTKVWAREHDAANYALHADNGVDEYADKLFAERWKEIRKAFPVCP